MSSIQPHKDRWLRCRRASSRRDSHVRGQQEDAELGLRYDRGLVSALAIDGDGKAKLPEHSRSVSRPFEADEFRASSLESLRMDSNSTRRSSVASSGQRVFTAKSSKLAGTIVSSRSNGERCTEPRGDSKTRSINSTVMRPAKLTPNVVERIEKAVSLGVSYDEAARAAGIHPSTFYRWRARGEAREVSRV